MPMAVLCANCNQAVQDEDRFCGWCGKQLRSGATLVSDGPVSEPSRAARADAGLLTDLRQATVGEYDIFGELGRGGMAVVYLAHELALNRRVAIKVLLPELLSKPGMADRFMHEAQTAAGLGHPNIIPIFAVRETDKLAIFVMRFVPGKPLDAIMTGYPGPMPIPVVGSILRHVGRALGHAHDQGVVHRDVKPANVLIDTDASAIVLDFGIAKRADVSGMTVPGTTLGTPVYMSPEQCRSRPVTAASDQYSLGVLAYEMIAGFPPFRAESPVELMSQHCHQEVPSLAEARLDCPAPMFAAVHRMLAKEPENRWPTMDAALEAMQAKALPDNDPHGLQLMQVVREGADDFLARVQTPRSPIPATQDPATARPGARSVRPHVVASRSAAAEALPSPRPKRRTWLRRAVAAVFVAGLAYVGVRFVLPARPGVVVIVGLPADGVVSANGVRQSGTTFELAPGEYDIVLTAAGFEPMTETVTLAAGAERRVSFIQRPLPGTVIVVGLPPNGRVTVGGEQQSDTIFALAPGRHEITLSAPGLASVTETLELAAGDEIRVPFIADPPPPRTGTVIVMDLPRGGVVLAAGRRQSTRFRLSAGRHEIRLSARGYETITRSVVVEAGRSVTVRFTGPALMARLQIVRILPVASVVIDGENMGERNRGEFPLRPNIRHILRFEHPDYLPLDTTVTLRAGEVRQWTITLRRRP